MSRNQRTCNEEYAFKKLFRSKHIEAQVSNVLACTSLHAPKCIKKSKENLDKEMLPSQNPNNQTFFMLCLIHKLSVHSTPIKVGEQLTKIAKSQSPPTHMVIILFPVKDGFSSIN